MNPSSHPAHWEAGQGTRLGTPAAERSAAVLTYAAAAGLVALTSYLLIVGEAILLPFVIAVFAWYLINAVAAKTSHIRIAGRPLPRRVRYGVAIVVLPLCGDPGREALVHRILQRTGQEIQTYVWLKTLFSAATGAASYAVMKAVGLDLAEFWAVLIFALNFIPYIGAWLGVIFPAFLALVQFETLTPFVIITGGLAIIQFVLGSIVEPRVMGTGLNVSPVVMLLSLAIWGTVWGMVGMFLAVPIMVVVMIVCSHVEATRPIAVLLSADGEVRT